MENLNEKQKNRDKEYCEIGEECMQMFMFKNDSVIWFKQTMTTRGIEGSNAQLFCMIWFHPSFCVHEI